MKQSKDRSKKTNGAFIGSGAAADRVIADKVMPPRAVLAGSDRCGHRWRHRPVARKKEVPAQYAHLTKNKDKISW